MVTLSGNTWTYEGKSVLADKQYLLRGTEAFTADGMSYTLKAEFSIDGKPWVPGGLVSLEQFRRLATNPSDYFVRGHISALRAKLGRRFRKRLVTVVNKGYMYNAERPVPSMRRAILPQPSRSTADG